MWNAGGNLVLQGHEDLKTNRVHRIFDYLCKIHLMNPWFPFPIRWLVHLEIHINFVGNKNYFLLKILSRKPSFLLKNLTDWHEESLQTCATRDWSHSWRKMTAGHGIWLLQLFVYFFRVCEVRQSMGKRNYNLTTSCRNSRKAFSRVLYYSPNRDAGSNPCEIPLDCIHLNPGTVKNPCALCERAIARNHKSICCEECQLKFHIKCAGITVKKYSLMVTGNKVGPVHHVIWILCTNFQFIPHHWTLR